MTTSSSSPLPALSVRQPWAEMILKGEKQVELRKWETPHRGTIAIHAGQAIAHGFAMTPDLMALFRGGYVGFCDVHSVVAMNPARWNAWRGKHLDPGEYQPGYFGWLLENPRRIETPITGRGEMGLYTPPPADQERLMAELQPGGAGAWTDQKLERHVLTTPLSRLVLKDRGEFNGHIFRESGGGGWHIHVLVQPVANAVVGRNIPFALHQIESLGPLIPAAQP